ncbi:MAG: hypothetical protein NVSMB68_08160 [Thermoanaerobaculia bacterium]
MRKTTLILAACAVLLLSGAAHAQSVSSDTYVSPIAGHAAGAFGSVYMTDVSITNITGEQLTVQLIVVEQGENSTDNVFPLVAGTINGSVVVPPHGTLVLRDVLNGFRSETNTAGAIILGGDKPFAVTSRLYNAKNGGVGDTVPAVSNFFENSIGRSNTAAIAYIPGIINNGSFRTNIGFLAATGSASTEPRVVEVRIRDAAGNSLGTKLISTQVGQFTQIQFPVSSITSTQFDIGSAEIRIAQGSGAVVPYAAVNDNATGSSQFILGQFPPTTALSARSFGANIFRDLFSRIGQ